MENAALKGMGDRFAKAWREKGPVRASAHALRTLCKPLVEAGSVRFFSFSSGAPLPDAASAGPRVAVATPEEANELLMERADPGLRDEIAQRFARGDRCITARDEKGRLLHTRWLSSSPTHVPELGLYVAPGPDQLYMYDGYTRREARGRGVDKAVRLFIFQLAKQEGDKEVLSYVEGVNHPGMKAARRLQIEKGAVLYLCFLRRWRLIMGRRRSPYSLLDERTLARRERERREREGALNQWFQSWLSQPLDKRSTGFSALPDAYFESAGGHIVRMLDVDPDRDEVLDVGCSSAGISRRVAPHSKRFAGVDATTGLIEDIDAGSIRTGGGEAAEFSVADGRHLPFARASFDKVYCTGVIHMLPTMEDALAMVDEMVRVCRPGGRILLGAVPDRAKKASGRRLVWRRSSPAGKARLLLAWLLPGPVRAGLQKLGLVRRNPISFLEFDMRELKARYQARGLDCSIVDYPGDYWSEDFRTSRSNLLMAAPVAAAEQPEDSRPDRVSVQPAPVMMQAAGRSG